MFVFINSSDKTKIHPVSQTVEIGDDVTITCYSLSDPQWTINDRRLPKNIVVEKQNISYALSIIKVDNTNKGTYECRGTDHDGQQFLARGVLKISCKLFQLYW